MDAKKKRLSALVNRHWKEDLTLSGDDSIVVKGRSLSNSSIPTHMDDILASRSSSSSSIKGIASNIKKDIRRRTSSLNDKKDITFPEVNKNKQSASNETENSDDHSNEDSPRVPKRRSVLGRVKSPFTSSSPSLYQESEVQQILKQIERVKVDTANIQLLLTRLVKEQEKMKKKSGQLVIDMPPKEEEEEEEEDSSCCVFRQKRRNSPKVYSDITQDSELPQTRHVLIEEEQIDEDGSSCIIS